MLSGEFKPSNDIDKHFIVLECVEKNFRKLAVLTVRRFIFKHFPVWFKYFPAVEVGAYENGGIYIEVNDKFVYLCPNDIRNAPDTLLCWSVLFRIKHGGNGPTRREMQAVMKHLYKLMDSDEYKTLSVLSSLYKWSVIAGLLEETGCGVSVRLDISMHFPPDIDNSAGNAT